MTPEEYRVLPGLVDPHLSDAESFRSELDDDQRDRLTRWVPQEFATASPLSACREAESNLAPIKETIRLYLQSVLRQIALPTNPPIDKGQAIARRINDLLASFHARLLVPGTQVSGTLYYQAGGYWSVRGTHSGSLTHRSLGDLGLSQITVTLAPPSSRAGRPRVP